MNTNKILNDLRAERARIDQAIKALESLNSTGRTVSRPAATSAITRKRPRRHISAAARKRLSELMKKRWSTGKMGRSKKPV